VVEPAFGLDELALRTTAVTAGVVPDSEAMAILTDLGVTPQCGGAAVTEFVRGFVVMPRERMAVGVVTEVLREDLLYRTIHVRQCTRLFISTATPPHSLSRRQPGSFNVK
jgi:hypothetical protein